MLLIAPLLQIVLFSSVVSSFAVLDPAGSIASQAPAVKGECTKQGGNSSLFYLALSLHTNVTQGLHAQIAHCKNVGPRCRLDGHGVHVCECEKDHVPPIPGSTMDAFHEILRALGGRISTILSALARPPADVESGDEEILPVLQKPYLSLEQNANSDTDERLGGKEEKKEEEEANKWDFLNVIDVPPRLDDITELPKCKPINMKCNPISGIRVCCPDLECIHAGPAHGDFECRQALEDGAEKEATVSSYEEKSGGKSQWFLGG